MPAPTCFSSSAYAVTSASCSLNISSNARREVGTGVPGSRSSAPRSLPKAGCAQTRGMNLVGLTGDLLDRDAVGVDQLLVRGRGDGDRLATGTSR